MEPQIQYATTSDGVNIAYSTAGEGLPLVATSVVWFSNLKWSWFDFGRGLQVVRYDARGSGLSDRHPMDFSIEARLCDLECIVDHLKLSRFALLGMLHGAPPAIAYAVRHPERVSHLILTNPFARGRDFRARMSVWDSLRDQADEQWEQYTLTLANADLGFSDSESARRLAARRRDSMTPESARAFHASLDTIDLTSLLPQVAVPTLVIHRANPSGLPLEWSREVASKIRGARFVTTRSGDDYPTWTDEQIRVVEGFLGVKHEDPAPTAAPAAARGGVTTVLFTDLVGHTEMMQRLGDAGGRDVLREHERITRETLKAHGGAEVKTMGDGFMASFGSVMQAMECAIALQRAFNEQNLEPGTENLNVRVGLNAGEPIEEDGDLFGSTVILASRIAQKAGAGEILVPETVRGLLSGKSFLFADRGEFVPKGFDDAVRLYEVRWREDG